MTDDDLAHVVSGDAKPPEAERVRCLPVNGVCRRCRAYVGSGHAMPCRDPGRPLDEPLSDEDARAIRDEMEPEWAAKPDPLEPCLDGNCILRLPGVPRGQHTNGGCQHVKSARDFETRHLLQHLAADRRARHVAASAAVSDAIERVAERLRARATSEDVCADRARQAGRTHVADCRDAASEALREEAAGLDLLRAMKPGGPK